MEPSIIEVGSANGRGSRIEWPKDTTRNTATMNEDQPPPIPSKRQSSLVGIIRTPIPLWGVLVALLLVFLVLAFVQRPLVEALWRKHHPLIGDGMRQAIDDAEKDKERKERDRLMREINGEAPPQPTQR
jgi:hypothetical protein